MSCHFHMLRKRKAAEKLKAVEAPVGEAPVEEAPVEEAPVEETPVEEAKTAEKPSKGVKKNGN